MHNIKLEIPVGKTSKGENFELKLLPRTQMNCFVSGCVGSGKTNLLRAIVKNTMQKYDDVEIWLLSCKSKEFYDLLPHHQGRLFDVDMITEKNMTDAVMKLHNESRERIDILKQYGVNSFAELNTDIKKTRLLVLIDDFHKLGQVLANNYELECMFSELLAIGRAIGLSFVITDQFPKNRCNGLSNRAKGFIQVLISFKNQNVFEALDDFAHCFDEAEKNRAYDYLIDTGSFITVDNSSNSDLFFTPHITCVQAEYIPYKP